MSAPPDAAAPSESPDTAGPSPGSAVDAARAARPSMADRLTSLAEVVLCSGLPTQLMIAVALAALGLPMTAADGGLSLGYVATLSLADSALVVALIVVFLRARGERPQVVLFGHRPAAREAIVGALLVPVVFALVAVVMLSITTWAPSLRNVADNPLASLLRDPWGIALFAVVAVVAGGLREETQRAFVLHRFEAHLGGAAVGLVIFSIAFGAGHALQGYDAAVTTGVLGAFWGALYLKRRSIVAPMVSHATFNLIEVIHHGLRS